MLGRGVPRGMPDASPLATEAAPTVRPATPAPWGKWFGVVFALMFVAAVVYAITGSDLGVSLSSGDGFVVLFALGFALLWFASATGRLRPGGRGARGIGSP